MNQYLKSIVLLVTLLVVFIFVTPRISLASTFIIAGDNNATTTVNVSSAVSNIQINGNNASTTPVKLYVSHGTLADTGAGSPGNETIYYEDRTFDAVSRYQTAYSDTVLTPIGLTAPTGYFGSQTRAQIKEVELHLPVETQGEIVTFSVAKTKSF